MIRNLMLFIAVVGFGTTVVADDYFSALEAAGKDGKPILVYAFDSI